MVYQWTEGFFYYGVDATEAGERLEALAERGKLTAEGIVDDARPEKAILHPLFEWDDEKAAEKYRKQQARMMLSNIHVTIEGKNNEAVETRAFVSISSEQGSSYHPLAKIMRSEKMKRSMLENAMSEMERFRGKYEQLRELAGVLNAMTVTVRRIKSGLSVKKPIRRAS